MRISATITVKTFTYKDGDFHPGTEDIEISPVLGITVQNGAGGRDIIIETADTDRYCAQYVETKITYDAGSWTRLTLVNE